MLTKCYETSKKNYIERKKTVFGMAYFDVIEASTTLLQLVYKATLL